MDDVWHDKLYSVVVVCQFIINKATQLNKVKSRQELYIHVYSLTIIVINVLHFCFLSLNKKTLF